MSVYLSPLQQQWNNSNGQPLAGGLLYSYVGGTTTPLATFTDYTGNTANTNPIVLNASGFAPVWISNNTYKFLLTDALGNQQFSIDGVSPAAYITNSPFFSVNMTYTQFQTAATSNAVAAFSLPANNLLEFIAITLTTQFLGSGITGAYAQMGPSGLYTFISDFNVNQVASSTTLDNSSPGLIGSTTASTTIYVNLNSIGANLSALTQGALTVSYKYEVL